MEKRNKRLLLRLGFLLVLGAMIFLVFWSGQILSQKQAKLLTGPGGDFEPGRAVLVEYGDFQCPACGLYYPLLKQLKNEFGDNLSVVFMHFPLRSIHKNADLASRAAEAALDQGKFWEMHDLLFENQKEWSNSDQAESLFRAYAVSLGLDQERFVAYMNSEEAKDKVAQDYQEGVSLRVSGTPTFFLNGERINNPTSYNEFKKLIQDVMAQ